jgi:PHD/YefM family antitoxin component YafN of YafNO toxin-antitoxin module
MATTTVSLEEIRRVADEVGDAADNGPVFVTRPGKLPIVLLTASEYRKLSGEREPVSEPVALPEGHYLPFDRSQMAIEEYRKRTGHLPNIVDMLANPEGYDIEFDPPRLGTEPCCPVDPFD